MECPLKIPERPMRAPYRTLREKALIVIEALVSDDFCEDYSYRNPNSLIAKRFISIYKFAHIGLGECDPFGHKDWKEELEKEYRYLRRHKVI